MTEEQARQKSLIIYEVMMIILMRNGAITITSNKKNHFMNGALYTMIQSTLNKKGIRK
jgi:hypothetical protein